MIVEGLPWCEPIEAAARLRPLGHLAFLDSAMRHERLGRYSYVAVDPFGLFEVEGGVAFWDGHALEGAPLVALRGLMRSFVQDSHPALPPFQGGAIGSFAYEFGACLERLDATPGPPWGRFPAVHLPFYDVVLAFDHLTRNAWLISTGLPARSDPDRQRRAAERTEFIRARLARPSEDRSNRFPISRGSWRSNFDADRYRAAVEAVREAILAGEIFQANIAQRYLTDLPDGFDPWAFYDQLRAENPAPFAAFLDQGARVLASSSPEMFVTLTDHVAETRPIKGTARRSDDSLEDQAAASRLLASEKDVAENTMIVDLLRNDLSRVCRPGSVAVPMLCGIESYAGVHHLVSAVTGMMKPGQDALDLLAATFPGGSITGAPKPQAMRVIARTEGEDRGAYCGSVACLGFDGSMSSSIAIRTVTIQGGYAAFQVGGGITALSNPVAEYQETLDKAERIFRAFESRRRAEAA